MNDIEIIRLVEQLSWDYPKESQQKAMKSLLEIDVKLINLLIQEDKKSTWENALIVLEKLSYSHYIQAVPKLIWLLQDMNWPGVPIAVDIMKKVNINHLIHCVEEALIKAEAEEDYMWIAGIQSVIDTLNIRVSDFQRKEIYEYLKLADW
ncbi:DUF5071 domain-containing protein [Alkaliphilus hydrothermalis]|uniref:DUF5071 domain-containing protein n=1 Tax=Alkaliphilus hydrothermalis TaxID=1482730 RepID=A0ABS2NTZ4_9FIRM|nr:DUF5071 domain-containing protein [Alkaliphilus hydrothermalis]MBM7616428.1 hypothetical protein [Alkaliphilus hydrothermalis]